MERPAAEPERPPHPVRSADPAAAGHDEEQLARAGFVRPDDPARFDLDAVHMTLATSLAQRERVGSVALINRDRRAATGSKIKKVHFLCS
jgi:hypothetical protein